MQQLFSGAEAAYRANSEYFLGTIVTIERTDSHTLSVVDRQRQRQLTTTYLLIAAIRDYFHGRKIGEEISTSLQNSYLFSSDRRKASNSGLLYTLMTGDLLP